VDDGVETAEPVDLRRHILGAGNGLQIAGDHLLGARQCPPRIVRALAFARMEDHPMPLLDEQLSSHCHSARLGPLPPTYGKMLTSEQMLLTMALLGHVLVAGITLLIAVTLEDRV
jgi:hypothetical protein